MSGDPVADARALVAELFPQARWAVLAGSVTTAYRTAGSDLDIVVLLPDGDPQAPHRDSRYFRGWPVELFVHDEPSLAFYLAKDLPQRRPVLHRMVATGVRLIGDPATWQERCAGILAAGPAPLTDTERDRVRYGLTDLLDDLGHATDPGERAVIAETAWIEVARQALALAGHWTGTGKWLLRELRALDTGLADEWLAAQGDAVAVEALVRRLLARVGGPLFAGYRVPGERPPSSVVSPSVRLTERLRLVPIGAGHAGELWRLHWDEGVAAWYGGRWTAQMALHHARRMEHAWRADGVGKWMAYDRATGDRVGRGGLSRAHVAGALRLEVGWVLHRDRWGFGYASEIGRAGLAFAFSELGADEVVAFTEPHNIRSRAVMRRLGMRHQRDIIHDGAPFVLYRTAAPPSGAGPAAADA